MLRIAKVSIDSKVLMPAQRRSYDYKGGLECRTGEMSKRRRGGKIGLWDVKRTG